jgi:sensor histidine kinase YesM
VDVEVASRSEALDQRDGAALSFVGGELGGVQQVARDHGSLIAYLRAAVPRLDEHDSSVRREVDLVRAYLNLMQMRMPDRLQYSISVDPDALALACPPTTLLTLVENAVRHGIDPAEQGGRIDVVVQLWADRCRLRVSDTGVGLSQGATGDARPASLGTGLSTLNERLRLAFDGHAQVRLSARGDRGGLGAEAEVEFPARRAAA